MSKRNPNKMKSNDTKNSYQEKSTTQPSAVDSLREIARDAIKHYDEGDLVLGDASESKVTKLLDATQDELTPAEIAAVEQEIRRANENRPDCLAGVIAKNIAATFRNDPEYQSFRRAGQIDFFVDTASGEVSPGEFIAGKQHGPHVGWFGEDCIVVEVQRGKVNESMIEVIEDEAMAAAFNLV